MREISLIVELICVIVIFVGAVISAISKIFLEDKEESRLYWLSGVGNLIFSIGILGLVLWVVYEVAFSIKTIV